MGINQFRPVLLYSAVIKERVCWRHLWVSILQTRGGSNPPDKCGNPAAHLPPQAARFKRRYRRSGLGHRLGGGTSPTLMTSWKLRDSHA